MPMLENKYFKIEVTLNGGSLTSIYDKIKNEELLYQGDDRSWKGQDVVIFPFIAALKDRKYMVDGKEYSLKNHGIVRYTLLNALKCSDNELILSLDSNEDTLKIYPYEFHFEVKYILNENELGIYYSVINEDNKNIYFNFGGHPALRVDGCENANEFVIKNTSLEFDKEYNTTQYILNEEGNLITHKKNVIIPKVMNITKNLICSAKTLIYDANDINNVVLHTKNRTFEFDIKEAEVLAIWTMPGYGDYVCVEPWWGIPDYENPNLELKDKPLIKELEPNKVYEKGFTIKIKTK